MVNWPPFSRDKVEFMLKSSVLVSKMVLIANLRKIPKNELMTHQSLIFSWFL
jgi:hypothetical protein